MQAEISEADKVSLQLAVNESQAAMEDSLPSP